MDENQAWKEFLSTGKVEDYLIYSKFKQRLDDRVNKPLFFNVRETDDNKNTGDSY